MKSSKLIILTISILLISVTGCIKEKDYTKWKLDNETYLQNMKDSTTYIKENFIYDDNINYYYKILTNGDNEGGSPGINDYVTVNYTGKLINGTIFEQTYSGLSPINNNTARPVKFKLGGLLYGWIVNLMEMKPGEIRTVVLPQQIGYGIDNLGDIPPYSTLIFDIQLISYSSN